MNTYNECEYIKEQYIQQGILNKDGTEYFDFNVYPWESGYVPKCSVCQNMFNTYQKEKGNSVLAPHKSCGCLWFTWFKNKLLNINSKIRFT